MPESAKSASAKMEKKLSASKTIEKSSAAGSSDALKSAMKVLDKKKKSGPQSPSSPACVARHPTGDKLRDTVRKRLCQSLFCKDDGVVDDESGVLPFAIDIETQMFSQLEGTSHEYKMKARELKFNLSDKKNRDLREEVLTRSLLAEDLVKLTSKDLANAEMKAERKKMHEWFMREAAAGNKPAATTAEFRCGKCKKRECTYYQMQTRSADEPLTTFVQCVACGNRWRF